MWPWVPLLDYLTSAKLFGQLIWSGTHQWNLRAPEFQTSWSNLPMCKQDLNWHGWLRTLYTVPTMAPRRHALWGHRLECFPINITQLNSTIMVVRKKTKRLPIGQQCIWKETMHRLHIYGATLQQIATQTFPRSNLLSLIRKQNFIIHI